MLSTTTTKKIKYNSGDSYKIVQWTGGLNCQLHDCVYFLSVSRVRAFDYVCCFCWFVCWSSLPPLMPFIHIFGISYEIILFASLYLSLSRLLSFALTRSPVDSFGRSGVPTMLLEIFFFIIFFSIRHKILHYCILLCARHCLRLPFFPAEAELVYDLLSIDDDQIKINDAIHSKPNICGFSVFLVSRWQRRVRWENACCPKSNMKIFL